MATQHAWAVYTTNRIDTNRYPETRWSLEAVNVQHPNGASSARYRVYRVTLLENNIGPHGQHAQAYVGMIEAKLRHDSHVVFWQEYPDEASLAAEALSEDRQELLVAALGRVLKRLRDGRDPTAVALAASVTPTQLYRLESGAETGPDDLTLERLAVHYGLTLRQLLEQMEQEAEQMEPGEAAIAAMTAELPHETDDPETALAIALNEVREHDAQATGHMNAVWIPVELKLQAWLDQPRFRFLQQVAADMRLPLESAALSILYQALTLQIIPTGVASTPGEMEYQQIGHITGKPGEASYVVTCKAPSCHQVDMVWAMDAMTPTSATAHFKKRGWWLKPGEPPLWYCPDHAASAAMDDLLTH